MNSILLRGLTALFQEGPSILLARIVNKMKINHQYKRCLVNLNKLDESKRIKRTGAKDFSYRPKVSIITPVFNTHPKWLRLCIESVLNQTYDNWELCIADGGSTRPDTRTILEQYRTRDNRVKVTFLAENTGIAGNSNAALAIASGEFVGFLDHDDELAPFAVYEVVRFLDETPGLDFIYSDEDKITVKGKRVDPHFKPDWSPDTLYSCNYITHFSVIRKGVIDKLGGFRHGYDGSQDYDLFLRVAEVTANIAHVPRVLYHWRKIPQSAASSSHVKSYAFIAAKKSIHDSLNRRKIAAEVLDGPSPGYYRVKYKVIDDPKVSIIIPVENKLKVLYRCVQSIVSKTSYQNYEILVVDDESKASGTSRYYEEIESNPSVKIIKYGGPFNYSKIRNYVVSRADSEYMVFLDEATQVISGEWLTAMLEHVQRREVGVAGALLYHKRNTIQHAGIILGIGGLAGHSHRCCSRNNPGYFNRVRIIQNVSAVSGACTMTKKSVFEKVGGFDEKVPFAFSDVDLCLRIRREGYLIVYTPYAELYHHGSLNRMRRDAPEQGARFAEEADYFCRKWKDVLAKGDPYYNPNLTLEKEDFSLRI